MVRWSPVTGALLAAGLLAGACSADDSGGKAIVDACLKSGQQEAVCSCLAKESAKRLDKPMYQVVVLGAQGNESETDRIMATLTPAAAQKFVSTTQVIAKTCGATPPATAK
jgi:hypothetical protein